MIIGILIGVSTMLVLFLCVFLGYKLSKREPKQKLTEEEREKLKKRDEGFQNIMNYDYHKALERR